MATIISSKTSGVGGLTVTGDASGILQLASADGTPALTINASQNVGIGTTDPKGKLHVIGMPLSLPATTGTTPTGLNLRLQNNDTGLVLDIGSNGAGGAWLQVANATNLAANYPLLLNPNGGNVGIGTSNPATKLTVAVSGAPTTAQATYVGDVQLNRTAITSLQQVGGLEFKASEYGSGYGAKITSLDGGDLVFGNRSNSATWLPRMTIDSSGNVGIGLAGSTANSKLSVYGPTGITSGATGEATGVGSIRIENGSSSLASDGGLEFKIAGDTNGYGSKIQTLNSGGSQLVFANRNGSATWIERMRINSSGDLLVGRTYSSGTILGSQLSPDGFIGGAMAASTSATVTLQIFSTTAAANRFYVDMGGTIHATSASISAISDATLKTNIKPLETGLSEVLKLQPRRFDWVNGDALNVAGFIAQEVAEILPELVEDSQYSIDINGDTIYKKNLKMGDILPTLVKAIQEQQTLIEALTERLTALEAK